MSDTPEKIKVIAGLQSAIKAPAEEKGKLGMVVYCDGGCRPNPGPGGWGLHGYMYTTAVSKKGAGNTNHVLTTAGYKGKPYIPSTSGEALVSPVHYVDGYGTNAMPITNNVAELQAAINAMRHAMNYDIGVFQGYTDSEYVCRGISSWIPTWARNGWIKTDGTAISNVELWKELSDVHTRLVHRGVSVSFDWVKGHTDSLKDRETIFGNVMADKLATIAVNATKRDATTGSNVKVSEADGYWSYDADRHPFISNRRMYFNTQSADNVPGLYLLGEHGKDDDLLGKRISDGAYSVVMLNEPDPLLEMIRNYQCDLAGETDAIVMLRLDHLYRPDTHREISTHGLAAIEQQNPTRLDLSCLDREPLSRELRPPKLAMRAVDALGELANMLNRYLCKHATIVVTDLTHILYETTVKAGKKGETTTSMKLKSEYNVGFAALQVDANYKLTGDDTASASVTLSLGIDLLDRNALKRLEAMNPKVTLITWNEAPNVFRYATVVEVPGGTGIWAGVYSNLRLVPTAKIA